MESNNTPQPRFADYLRPITSRWLLVLVAVVVATGGVYAYYAHKPNVYTAGTLVYITNPGDPVSGIQSSPTTDRNVDDVASLLDTRATAAAVAQRIHFHGSPAALLGDVVVASKTGEDFLTITANSGGANESAAIANAFAQQFVLTLADQYTSRVNDAITTLQGEIHRPATSGAVGQVARDGLIGQLEQLELDRRVPTTVASQVSVAVAPGAPSAPKPKRNAIYAFLISLVGAIALCYGLERFDRRLKTPEDIESAFAMPVLSVLPHSADPVPVKAGAAVLGPDFRESFRSLRTSIELASVDAPPRVIVVTSAMPGEGKSTVVRNLALALCESGKRVAVVDLDLRNPSLSKLFKVWVGPGFTDVLRGSATRREATHEITTGLPDVEEFVPRSAIESLNGNGNGNGNHKGHHDPGSDPRLAFILAGTRPANPPAVLSSGRTAELLDELKQSFDVVLLDSAPVLAVTDTVPLLRYADATLFVGRFGVTTRDTVKRLRDFLARVPDVNVLGVVANELPRLDASSYGYGYGYGNAGSSTGPGSGWRGTRLGSGDKQKQTV